MGRRQGGPSRTGAKEAYLNTIPPSAIWLIFQGASDEHIEIRTREASSAAAGQKTGQRAIGPLGWLERVRLRRCSFVTYRIRRPAGL